MIFAATIFGCFVAGFLLGWWLEAMSVRSVHAELRDMRQENMRLTRDALVRDAEGPWVK